MWIEVGTSAWESIRIDLREKQATNPYEEEVIEVCQHQERVDGQYAAIVKEIKPAKLLS